MVTITTTAPAGLAPLGVLDLVIVTPTELGCRPFYGEIVAVRDGAYKISYRAGRNCEWFDAAQVTRRPRRYIG